MLSQQLINGLVIGSTYALVTVGFNMVYGVLRLTNLAHSSFYMLAAYIGQFFLFKLMPVTNPFLAVLIVAIISIIITGLLGGTMDRAVLKPIRDRRGSPLAFLIATAAVQLIINNSILVIFGTEALRVPNVFSQFRIVIGDNIIIQGIQAIIVLVTIVILGLLLALIYKTKFGKGMRALSQNVVSAQLSGVNTEKTITTTFIIGSSVAAISGLIVSMYYQSVTINLGASMVLKMFAASVLGGIGSLSGGVIGGLLIGIIETLFAAYISPGYRDVVSFIILVVVLIIKPTGLLGKKTVEKV